jgi:hypothetical protein
MDPYLERRWGTVHGALAYAIAGALQGNLPPGLRARGEQDVFPEEQGPDERLLFEADVAVVEMMPPRFSAESSTAVIAEPFVIRLEPVIERHRWVQIIDTADNNRVVTVIEILSPGNKSSSKLNKRYRRKLREYMRAGVSIVEIDLLRSGRGRLLLDLESLPRDRRADYYTCINWAKDPDRWSIYPMPLRQALPTIPIPCRETDADVPLALQPVLDRVYAEGGHDDMDYRKELRVPLEPKDAEWAAGIVRAARPG